MGMWTLGVVVVCVASWAPPSVEEIRRLAEEYQAAATPQRWNPERDGSPQKYLARVAAETLAKVGDPGEFGLEHFEPLLETNLFLYAQDSSAYLDRLLVLAQDESVIGARAALNSFALAGHASKERQAEALDLALEHPATGEALREPGAWSHLTAVWYMFPADLGRDRASAIMEVVGPTSVPEKPTLWDVMGGVRLLDWMRSGNPEVFDEREPLRLALVELVTRARGQVRDDDPQFARLSLGGLTPTQYLEAQLAYLTGPEATGTLVGAAAPDLEFAWRSDEQLPEALSGLRGRVVVLDFFETWCGPCIAGFPEMRELVERYGPDGVAFVGVTSLEKSAAEGGDGQQGVEADAARVRVITEFMAEHQMTWPVVFIPGSVFEPSYGVNGIPHITVIGANGVVLGNDVAMEELAGVIEGALGR